MAHNRQSLLSSVTNTDPPHVGVTSHHMQELRRLTTAITVIRRKMRILLAEAEDIRTAIEDIDRDFHNDNGMVIIPSVKQK